MMEDLERLYVNSRYRLKDRFDAGSHGEVWLATTAAAPGRFVLKRLFLELGDEMVHMGLREAHFGALLSGERHVTRFIEYFFRPPLGSAATRATPRTDPESFHGQELDASSNGNSTHRHTHHHQPEAPTPELWLVFHDEGMSLRHFLYSKQETYSGSDEGTGGVILQRSLFWDKMRTDAKGELVLREILRQLLEGVAALHARGITHRDIKPSNILLTIATGEAGNAAVPAPVVKLADFGSAVDDYTVRHLYPAGKGPSQAEETREYQPPEVLFDDYGKPFDFAHPLAYDMWSVGVVFLEMVLGSPQVFMISPRAQVKLDAELQHRQQHRKPQHEDDPVANEQTRSKAYLLHVLTHEFCIFQPPSQQLRTLWDKYALVSESCHFGKFNKTVVERDPLHKGLENPYALDLMWKMLQWLPERRISAAEALEHAFFRGPYVCASSGRQFATKKELELHKRYLRVQEKRDRKFAIMVREPVEAPDEFECGHCHRKFATVASCEQHLHARRHFGAGSMHFCRFEAPDVAAAIQHETAESLSTSSTVESPLSTTLDVGMALLQGRKKYMEDFLLVQRIPALGDAEVYAVSDGHLGSAAATFVLSNLVEVLTRHFSEISSRTSTASHPLRDDRDRESAEKMAMRQTFLELHEQFLLYAVENFGSSSPNGTIISDEYFSGCTLTVIVYFPNERRLVSANVGDSRSIAWVPSEPADDIQDTIIPLSMDHWPDVADERARIESSGGFVNFSGLWRVVGQLAVSRSIGDRHLRQFVTAEPSVFHLTLPPPNSSGNGLLVVASDGLWETMSSVEVAWFLEEQTTVNPLQSLPELAAKLVAQSYVRGSFDNIAVMLARLP